MELVVPLSPVDNGEAVLSSYSSCDSDPFVVDPEPFDECLPPSEPVLDEPLPLPLDAPIKSLEGATECSQMISVNSNVSL